MQAHSNISLIRYLSMRDFTALGMRTSPKYDLNTFSNSEIVPRIYSSEVGGNALQLAAKYSDSAEVLKILLQIDHMMTKAPVDLNNR
jgi:hypothetical protein